MADDGRAPRRILWAFVVSAAASIGLTVVYALGGQPQVEGALIGLSLGGLAVGLVLWGKHLLPHGPYVEEREPLGSTAAERGAVAADVRRGGALTRRRLLRAGLGGALAALAAALVLPIRSLGPRPGRTLFRTAWVPGARLVTPDGIPVSVAALAEGGVLTVFPEGHTDAADAQAVLVRVDPTIVRLPPGREDWAPQGYVAYSKICTHAGCPVGLYEPQARQLFCPCHQSVFDVSQGAAPVAGPATRALPQLPLEVGADGFLRARGDFPEPVGPAFWELPEETP
ncbi:MAG TPA: Rieske 2Fe-2S domain-containing protein [Actinomycetota bacterium]|nr:Rieske 2Fe-2S domain-containing protein [Actinomycetota bacterium]